MTDDASTRDPGSYHIVHLPDDPARTVVWEGDCTHRSVFTHVSLSNLLRGSQTRAGQMLIVGRRA